jgi:hypothetical protein
MHINVRLANSFIEVAPKINLFQIPVFLCNLYPSLSLSLTHTHARTHAHAHAHAHAIYNWASSLEGQEPKMLKCEP